jgi:hypothetical protein
MTEIVVFLSQSLVSLSIAQIVGLAILLAGLDSDDEIAARSGTYWGHNPHMLKHLVGNNYDQKLGLFLVTLPTILQATTTVPFWSSYACLIVGLLLRFTPIRTTLINKRIKRIEKILNKEENAA